MRVMCSCIYCRSIVLPCSSLWVLLLSLLGVSMGGHYYIVLHLCFIVLNCATLGRMGGQDKESRSGKQVSRPAGALTKIQIESPKGEREAQREVLSVTKLKPTRAHREVLNTSTQEHTGHRDVFSTTLRSDKQWVLGEAFFFCSQIWKEENVNKLEKTKLLFHVTCGSQSP